MWLKENNDFIDAKCNDINSDLYISLVNTKSFSSFLMCCLKSVFAWSGGLVESGMRSGVCLKRPLSRSQAHWVVNHLVGGFLQSSHLVGSQTVGLSEMSAYCSSGSGGNVTHGMCGGVMFDGAGVWRC